MNEPETFFCICCEEYWPVAMRQENGLCQPCSDIIKSWTDPWVPSWNLIFFLGFLAILVEVYNRNQGG